MTDVLLSHLSKDFVLPDGQPRPALHDIGLRIPAGEFVAVLGPSGCGKSTLLNIVAGLDRSYSGSVELIGQDREEPRVSYMFQEPRLLPWMSVFDNLAFVLDGPARGRRATITSWLQRVGLAGRANDYPFQLSVGMQQRVAVARALMVQPDLLLMDEPFSSLDELTALGMRTELLELWKLLGCTVILVTHNALEAVYLADRLLIMSAGPGRIIADEDLRTRLPRPRESDDAKIWSMARHAVGLLGRGNGGAADGTNADHGEVGVERSG